RVGLLTQVCGESGGIHVGSGHHPPSAPLRGRQSGVDLAGAALQSVVAFIGVLGAVGLGVGAVLGARGGEVGRHGEQDLAVRVGQVQSVGFEGADPLDDVAVGALV